jgi:hypothetical protein
MRSFRPAWGGMPLAAWAVIAMMLLIVDAHAQGSRLGSVRFPTSARSPEAQAHFLRGVAALHSFWYPVALEEFRTATRIEPDFALGYWGEAMAHNYPVWGDPQDTEAARQVLARDAPPPLLPPRGSRPTSTRSGLCTARARNPRAIRPMPRPWRRSISSTRTT